MAKILGIEIGSSITRICEMDYKTKNPKLYKFVCIPTPRGVVDDGFIQENVEFSLALKKVLSDNKITTKQVIFTVSSSKIVTREVSIPAVKTNQVGTYIRANATDYFPIDLTLYELAHMNLGAYKAEDGSDKLRVMVIAASKELISGYSSLAASCGLRLQSIDYAGNSVYQIMKEETTSQTELVVKVEENSTIASVISNGSLVLQRNLAFGIDRAVQAMVAAPEYPEDTYEAALNTMCRRACVKVVLSDRTRMIEPESNAGESETVTEARKRITETFTQMIGNISRMVELHNQKDKENPITQITLVGVGSEVVGLYKLFTNELGIATRVVKNLRSVSYFHSVDQESIAKYISAIGSTFEPVNLMSLGSKQKVKTTVDYGKLSILLAIVFIALNAYLCFLSIPPYLEAQQEEKDLKSQEATYAPAEPVYHQYNGMVAFYKEVLTNTMQTEHPNNNLIPFLEELEKKIISDASVMEFTSTKENAVIMFEAPDYEAAAKLIETMRTFDSVQAVAVTSITEVKVEAVEASEDREATPASQHVEFEVICFYYGTNVPEALAEIQAQEAEKAAQEAQAADVAATN